MRAGSLIASVAAAALVLAPGAGADAVLSSNWAGYAIHRKGLSFDRVSAVWTQPSATCPRGRESFSSFWVGLGGFKMQSRALEQVGTEMDCSRSGRRISTAWYELVPAPSRVIHIAVRAGDVVAASVAVRRHRVVLTFADLTLKRSFKKTLRASRADISSAEWIVEAPSVCLTRNACLTLPLADFGSATFDLADARSRSGHSGTISDPDWSFTRVTLSPGGRRFVVYQGTGPAFGAATASALQFDGAAFQVNFMKVSLLGNAFLSDVPRSGYLVHPGR